MDFRSYLRGLGVGMAVTTVVLVIAFTARSKEPTNAEIVSMARELGMVETQAFASSEKNTDAQTSSAEPQTEPEITQPAEEGSTDALTEAAEETTAQIEIVVQLSNIEQACLASEALAEAGVISDIEEFNTYLIKNGYSRIIRDGTYTFTPGMTYEEIAKIICRGKSGYFPQPATEENIVETPQEPVTEAALENIIPAESAN